MRFFIFLTTFIIVSASSYAGPPILFTVNLDETVVVTGTPRLQLDIGGVTRYAPYVSGSGTNALSFSYPVVAPDFDRDGITLVSPLDLNGGTIRDTNGNDANLAFTLPNTAGVLVQSYTASWTTSPVNATNETATAFDIVNAPIGATFNYTITSDGGGGSVTGSGSIAASPQSVTGVNVSSLPAGLLTLSVTVTNGTGTGNAKTDTVSGAFTGVLDSLPASAAAYSVRRLRSGYTGALIRVRRSSDSTEQDIGYTLGGNLNTMTLTTFCGANSCFVTTWYDQSGNVRNATQGTPANQPRIVNAGVIDTIGGRGSLQFLGAQFMTANSVTQNLLGNTPTFSAVVSPNSIAAYIGIIVWRGGSTNGLDMNNASRWTYIWNDAAATFNWNGGPVITTGSLQTVNVTISPTFATYNKDGTSFTNTTTHAATSGTANAVIGNDNCCGGRFLNGYLPELILFQALSPVNNATLEANQKTYYGIL
jgi:hypothetical protein